MQDTITITQDDLDEIKRTWSRLDTPRFAVREHIGRVERVLLSRAGRRTKPGNYRFISREWILL